MSSKTIYDKHGNRIGEDVITTDRDGRIHITHYDNHNNRIGRSYETTDIWGKVFMVHEDADGKRLATSTLEQDWWGDYYVKTEQTQNVLSDVIKVLAMAAFSLVVGVLCFNIVGMASITIWPYLLMGPLNMIIGFVPIGLLFFVLGGDQFILFPVHRHPAFPPLEKADPLEGFFPRRAALGYRRSFCIPVAFAHEKGVKNRRI